MQNVKDENATLGGGAQGRRVALGIKIALGQVGASDGLISEDDAAQALFDLGFEIGHAGNLRDIVTVLQGVLGGLEQSIEDDAANDNQGRLDLGE
jgi:hypothetical protein